MIDFGLFYFLIIVSMMIYFVFKIKYRKYLFSAFNISFFVYSFGLLISPIYYFFDNNWWRIGINSFSELHFYMSKTLMINAVGYFFFIIALIYSEMSNKDVVFIKKFTKILDRNISKRSIDVVFFPSIVMWHFFCLKYCKGYPLINGNRTFFLGNKFSFFYSFLNECIVVIVLIYLCDFLIKKQGGVKAIIGLITVALQGNRSSLIVYLIVPFMLYAVYWNRGKQLSKYQMIYRLIKILAVIFFIGVIGILIQLVRKNVIINTKNIVREVFLGNTFSDIRDGAAILKGFETAGNGVYILGKTFLAGLISFLPSSICQFRQDWSWGRYVTQQLLHLDNHFGLRGGNSLEAYINFGWFGVVVFSVLLGVVSGYLERAFYKIIIKKEKKFIGLDCLAFSCVIWVRNFFISGNNTYNLYVDIVLIVILVIVTNIEKRFL